MATTTASDDLLRTQPEVTCLISKLVSAGVVQQQKLDEVLLVMNAVANGQFQVALPGPLTAKLFVPGLSAGQPTLVPSVPNPPPPAAAPNEDVALRLPEGSSPRASAPAYELFDARSVADVWREWSVGIAGRPALQVLEQEWGHFLRPTARQRTAWSRRKVVLDELRRLIARGSTEEAAVAELEALRAGRSLRRLIDDPKSRKSTRN